MSTLAENTGAGLRSFLAGTWLAGAVAVGMVGIAPAARAEGQQVSKAVYEKYEPASEAYKKHDFATALRLGKEALAAAKSGYEKQVCLTIVYGAAVGARSYADAVEAGEQILTLDGVAAKTRLDTQRTLGQLYAQLNKMDKAIAATKEYIKWSGGSAADWDLLAQLHSANRDCASALAALDKALAGRTPDEKQLNLQSNCYYKEKNVEKRIAVNEELMRRFPKSSYYKQLLVIYQTDKKIEDNLAMLELLRLGFERDYLDTDADFVKLADLALDVGTTAEAQRVLERGLARKIVKGVGKDGKSTDKTAERAASLLDQAKKRAVEDKGTLAQLDAEARAGKNGESDYKVGLRYFGLGQYDKAAEALQRGLQPDRVGRVKRPDDANVVLGMALLKLKKTSDAGKAFTAAKADPRMASVAKLWVNAI